MERRKANKYGERDVKVDVFFFSSRRRHTRYWRDWSSDVSSSDLIEWTTCKIKGFHSFDCFP